MKNRKIDKKTIKQVVIDIELHKLVKIEAARSKKSIKSLVETSLLDYLDLVKIPKDQTN